MKLSIITVNLNNRIGLERTINSVVSQTFKDFEWIVIDGGSTDGSKELITQYANHFAYWVSEPDKGIYNAMNKGIKVAKGEYLLFLNSGDWIIDERVAQDFIETSISADIISGDVCLVYDENTMPIKKSPSPEDVGFDYFFHYIKTPIKISYIILSDIIIDKIIIVIRNILGFLLFLEFSPINNLAIKKKVNKTFFLYLYSIINLK